MDRLIFAVRFTNTDFKKLICEKREPNKNANFKNAIFKKVSFEKPIFRNAYSYF